MLAALRAAAIASPATRGRSSGAMTTQADGERDQDDDRGRRQDAAGPPGVEGGKVDAPGALALAQQQAGDQEAGEDEEDVHPDVAARDPGHAGMERQDQEDGQPAQPLKVRSEGLAARPLGALHASRTPSSVPSRRGLPASGSDSTPAPMRRRTGGRWGRVDLSSKVAGPEVTSAAVMATTTASPHPTIRSQRVPRRPGRARLGYQALLPTDIPSGGTGVRKRPPQAPPNGSHTSPISQLLRVAESSSEPQPRWGSDASQHRSNHTHSPNAVRISAMALADAWITGRRGRARRQ